MTTDRIPMAEVDWFIGNERLAIADVVFVRGIGLCSHQPAGRMLYSRHRVRSLSGRIYITDSHSLYDILPGENSFYWETAEWT